VKYPLSILSEFALVRPELRIAHEEQTQGAGQVSKLGNPSSVPRSVGGGTFASALGYKGSVNKDKYKGRSGKTCCEHGKRSNQASNGWRLFDGGGQQLRKMADADRKLVQTHAVRKLNDAGRTRSGKNLRAGFGHVLHFAIKDVAR